MKVTEDKPFKKIASTLLSIVFQNNFEYIKCDDGKHET